MKSIIGMKKAKKFLMLPKLIMLVTACGHKTDRDN